MLDPVLLQSRDRALEVRGAEGHMVDHAAPLGGQLRLRHVQDRAPSGVEPRAVEAERWALAFGQSDDADVETPRRVHVVGEDVEVVHAFDAHGTSVTMTPPSTATART